MSKYCLIQAAAIRIVSRCGARSAAGGPGFLSALHARHADLLHIRRYAIAHMESETRRAFASRATSGIAALGLFGGMPRAAEAQLVWKASEWKLAEHIFSAHGTYLLPMPYPAGSPPHPSYPAAHSAIVGAGVTLLKAFFNESFVIPNPVVASDDGLSLVPYTGASLTVGGDLNKRASNISRAGLPAGSTTERTARKGSNSGKRSPCRYFATLLRFITRSSRDSP
jgi:hypothetical protein